MVRMNITHDMHEYEYHMCSARTSRVIQEYHLWDAGISSIPIARRDIRAEHMWYSCSCISCVIFVHTMSRARNISNTWYWCAISPILGIFTHDLHEYHLWSARISQEFLRFHVALPKTHDINKLHDNMTYTDEFWCAVNITYDMHEYHMALQTTHDPTKLYSTTGIHTIN